MPRLTRKSLLEPPLTARLLLPQAVQTRNSARPAKTKEDNNFLCCCNDRRNLLLTKFATITSSRTKLLQERVEKSMGGKELLEKHVVVEGHRDVYEQLYRASIGETTPLRDAIAPRLLFASAVLARAT